MTRFAMIAATVAATGMLAGCGGGNGENKDMAETPTMPDPGPPDMRTAGQMLQDGETLPAHHVAAVKAELGKLRGFKWDTFNVNRADADGVVFDVDGLTYELEFDDDDGFVRDNRSIEYTGETATGVWYADSKLYFIHPERDEYMAIARIQSDGPDWRGYAVAGNRSRLDDTWTGTAIYDGDVSAHIDVFSAEGRHWSEYRDSYWARDGRLVADFDAMTISGQLSDWYTDAGERDENGNWPGIDISMTLEPAPITAAGFTGAVSFTGLDAGTTADISYEGSLYGPEAENVAGVFNGTFTPGAGQAPGPVIGWFSAEDK